MKNTQSIRALNRLVAIHNRSLARYLASARPWTRPGDEAAMTVLRLMAADQLKTVDRLAGLILELGGRVQMGEFPMDFTSLHDLNVDYLLQRVVAGHKRDIAAIEECVDELRLAPLARALAEESLGAAKGHLDSLQELIAARKEAKRSSGPPPQLALVTGH